MSKRGFTACPLCCLSGRHSPEWQSAPLECLQGQTPRLFLPLAHQDLTGPSALLTALHRWLMKLTCRSHHCHLQACHIGAKGPCHALSRWVLWFWTWLEQGSVASHLLCLLQGLWLPLVSPWTPSSGDLARNEKEWVEHMPLQWVSQKHPGSGLRTHLTSSFQDLILPLLPVNCSQVFPPLEMH